MVCMDMQRKLKMKRKKSASVVQDRLRTRLIISNKHMKIKYPLNTWLLIMQAEVDKTGASYYGKQQLHYMTSK